MRIASRRSSSASCDEIATLKSEAKAANNMVTSVSRGVKSARSELRSLQATANRMILSQEDMEEVVLKDVGWPATGHYVLNLVYILILLKKNKNIGPHLHHLHLKQSYQLGKKQETELYQIISRWRAEAKCLMQMIYLAMATLRVCFQLRKGCVN